MKEFFGIASFVLTAGVAIPYVFDVIHGRAKLARSTRILLFILVAATLIVQSREFTSWTLALTVGQMLIQIVLLTLAIKYGIGGLDRLDKISYGLFAVAITGYLVTDDAFVGLLLLCITDVVAFMPTIMKNWRDPSTDTPLFYIGGIAAAFLSVLAASDLSDINQTLFPAYLVFVDMLALAPLLLAKRVRKNADRQ